jgi:hypothetical protein
MSILKVSPAREALFPFRMSLSWPKNLSTAALEGPGVVNLTKSWERSSHQLHSICLVDVVQAPFDKCLCDGDKSVILRVMFFPRYSLKLTFKKY